MSLNAPLDDFSSILDFCFDLDVDLDLQLPIFATLLQLPSESPLVPHSEPPSSVALFTRWSNHWWPRPLRLCGLPRLILKIKTNRNFHKEVLQAQMAETEDVEDFCARLETLISTPGDVAYLHRERVRQLAHYYGTSDFV